MSIYTGDKDKRRRSNSDKYMWIVITSCNIIFAIYLLQYKAPATTPCTSLANPIIIAKNTTQLPFYLARSQSFGFFYDISNDHWRLYKDIYNTHIDHRYPNHPMTYNPEGTAQNSDPIMWSRRNNWPSGYFSYAAWWQNNYEPNFSCPFEKRVGIPMNGDGPKWVCDPHRINKLAEARKQEDPNHPGCVVYSVGSNGDFSFELGMQKEVGVGVCEYHIFDMGDYAKEVPPELKRAYYHKWGLEKQQPAVVSWFGSTDVKPVEGKEFYGLYDTVKLLGHEDLNVIDIFKIDCEGCEWKTYQDWLSDDIPMLHQIQVEVHKAPIGTIDFFKSMEEFGYMRYHKESNIQWGSDCIEYGFVKVEKAFMDGKKELEEYSSNTRHDQGRISD